MPDRVPARMIIDRFQMEAWAIIQRDLLHFATMHQKEAFLLGVLKAQSELGLEDLYDPRALAFVTSFEYRAIRSLTARTSIMVQQELLDAVRQGLGVDDLAARLDKILGGRVATVDTIARTETNRAASWGRMNGWKQSGIVRQKESIATLDDRVRPDHLAAHGEVVGIDEPFTIGAAAGYLAPPYDPNCRCAVAPVTRLTEGVQDGQVVQDAEAAQTFATENDIALAVKKHGVPGLIAAEEIHAKDLRAAWNRGLKRFQDLLQEANR